MAAEGQGRFALAAQGLHDGPVAREGALVKVVPAFEDAWAWFGEEHL